ncbi:hypothetical protein GCM10017772_17910 [Promicromonospora soli]|uniref:Ig-like domain-containing protein n=1 Tax=Promicromonospora soli TaxID=2035533 RepID=A0A919FS88_9MICO|nr:hypothetical protein GCM10017772_17910 [Promicromonospora soli]
MAEPIDPTFVQEGMPSLNGGQVVAWGDLGGPLPSASPRALPDGVHAVGMSADKHQVMVLRSDGRVDVHPYDVSGGTARHLIPPTGTTFVAVSADWYGTAELLRSDGVVVNAAGEPTKTPPEGLEYTAISGHLALRSDGTLDPAPVPGESCPESRDPGTGLRYTAVTALPRWRSWAALRSDGAYVHCGWPLDGAEGSEPMVVKPPAGTIFVGIDMSLGEVVGATADGRIISSGGRQLATAPPGRSIVSLATLEQGAGAATLDDGSILEWGLSEVDSAPPLVPADRAVFSAVGGYTSDGQHWAIVVGDPVPVEVSVEPVLPLDRPLRVTDSVQVSVTAALADGMPVPGQAEPTVRAPDGGDQTLAPVSVSRSDPAEISLSREQHAQIGTHTLNVAFSGAPYITTTVETPLDFVEPSPVVLTTSGPTTWHRGTENSLCFTLATEDGSPLWWTRAGQATISVEGDPGQVYQVWQPSWESATVRSCMHYLALQPGTYTAHFDYEGWSAADSASWTGQVVVLPPARTQVESDLPTGWRYGQMPDVVWADVTSEGPVPSGYVHLQVDGSSFGSGDWLDATGRGRLWIGDEEELVPGSYSMVVRYSRDPGFLLSKLERTVFVRPAVFTTKSASISGTPKVGQTLTAVPGTWSPTPTSYLYTWKVDGVVVLGATSSTFTVPASAAGKTIKVLVTGLRQYYESLAASAPVTVAPGTFTAPRPTITGTKQVGSTLTVSRGTWSPQPTSVTYVWKADGVKIATRTSNQFVIPVSARGKHLTVTVIGSRTGYTTKSVTSYRTVTIR